MSLRRRLAAFYAWLLLVSFLLVPRWSLADPSRLNPTPQPVTTDATRVTTTPANLTADDVTKLKRQYETDYAKWEKGGKVGPEPAKNWPPNPSEYLSPEQVKLHEEQFKNGATRIQLSEDFYQYGAYQRDAKAFVVPTAQWNDLVAKAKASGNNAVIADALNLMDEQRKKFIEAKNLDSLVRTDFPAGTKVSIPNGLEAGANVHWEAGGKTASGLTEGVVARDAAKNRETPLTPEGKPLTDSRGKPIKTKDGRPLTAADGTPIVRDKNGVATNSDLQDGKPSKLPKIPKAGLVGVAVGALESVGNTKNEYDRVRNEGGGKLSATTHAAGQILDGVTLGAGPAAKGEYDRIRNEGGSKASALTHAGGQVLDKVTVGIGPAAKSEYDKSRNDGDGKLVASLHAAGQPLDILTLGAGPAAKQEYDKIRNGGGSKLNATTHAAGQVLDKVTLGVGPRAKQEYDKSRKNGDNKLVSGGKAALKSVTGLLGFD